MEAEIAEAVAIAEFAAENEWPADALIELVGQRPARVGAEGTPILDEFVALELAGLKGISVSAATWLIRDIVNLQYRHPRLWGRVRAGAIPVFRACQLAAEIARFELSADQLEQVDDQLVDNASRLSWRRLANLCRGLIADLVPEQLAQCSRQALAERYVRKLPTDDPTVAYLSARVDTADAVFFDAMVDRIADLLAIHGDDDNKEIRRAKSVGILATPARATLLLAQAAARLDALPGGEGHSAELSNGDSLVSSAGVPQPNPASPNPMYGTDACGAVRSGDVIAANTTTADPTAAGIVPVWRSALAALPTIRWSDPKLLSKSTTYLHVAEDTVMHGRGPVRADNIGAIAATMLGLLVGHTRITLTPVVRPFDNITVDAYEIPDRIRQQVILRDQIEVFPYSSRPARNLQLDHTIAYRKSEPGQTNAANLGPLSTKVHRAKTHGH